MIAVGAFAIVFLTCVWTLYLIVVYTIPWWKSRDRDTRIVRDLLILGLLIAVLVFYAVLAVVGLK